ncbi:MAG: ParB/RepB/Spo0J family partition protein [Anaerovoracaceae bacterium]|uniref:ParB/RepB/Spo0J family partition protein n=1 Tax=Candidatus Allocopromorpha excrementavium TaxID=2840741 RepID=A0A9D1HD76_9FIRM|nr:ParB/RepB/Spo0J family partition protein [Candidatus Copromorpha excrementavium]
MSKKREPLDFNLPTLDDLFSTQEERDDAKLERVKILPVNELVPFKDHPFKILDDEDMHKLIESIKEYGVYTPLMARPLPNGNGYELISGHRRLAAFESLGIEEIPVIVRNMSDDEAVIAMVDANLQRESVLPSEKAFAYKMKLEAMKRQGKRNDLASNQLGRKLETAEIIGQKTGDSKNQVRRYIRLTHLIPELLEKVDNGKIAFNPAVEISFLTEEEQTMLNEAMELNDCTPSHAQTIRLKKLSHDSELTEETINEIMSEEKPNQREQIKFDREDFRKYFPSHYTNEQIKRDILEGLRLLKRKKERNMDAR